MVSYLPTSRYAAAGIKRVLVAAFAVNTRFWLTGPDYLTISAMNPAPTWHILQATPQANAIQPTTLTKQGMQASQKVSLTFTDGQSVSQREALLALFQQPVYCLFEDLNGGWWLAGQCHGLRPALTQTTGQTGGDTIVTLELTGLEPAPWRAFDAGAAWTIYAATAIAAGGE